MPTWPLVHGGAAGSFTTSRRTAAPLAAVVPAAGRAAGADDVGDGAGVALRDVAARRWRRRRSGLGQRVVRRVGEDDRLRRARPGRAGSRRGSRAATWGPGAPRRRRSEAWAGTARPPATRADRSSPARRVRARAVVRRGGAEFLLRRADPGADGGVEGAGRASRGPDCSGAGSRAPPTRSPRRRHRSAVSTTTAPCCAAAARITSLSPARPRCPRGPAAARGTAQPVGRRAAGRSRS